MRQFLLLSAVVILAGSGATYAVLGTAQKVAAPVELPPTETASLFSARFDASPHPDLIAAKLAMQPIIWPVVPQLAAKQKTSKIAVAVKKQKQARKPKLKISAAPKRAM